MIKVLSQKLLKSYEEPVGQPGQKTFCAPLKNGIWAQPHSATVLVRFLYLHSTRIDTLTSNVQ